MTEPLPGDPALPHLRLALDPQVMRERLGRHLAGGTVEDCAVERSFWRPQQALDVSYRLLARDGQGRRVEYPVLARWCRGGEAARRHARASAFAGRPGWAGPRVTHDAPLDMLARWWPGDATLPGSAALGDAHALRTRWLPDALGLPPSESAADAAPSLQLLRLQPDGRATVRLAWQDHDGRVRRSIVRSDGDGRGAARHTLLRALWDSPAQRRGDLLTPRPMRWQSASALQWEAELAGRPLATLPGRARTEQSARAGAMLAALHGTAVPGLRSVTLEEIRRAPTEMATRLAQADESLAARARPLAAALSRRVWELALSPMVTLHGRPGAGSLLLSDDGPLALVGFDAAARGPAVLDLGGWIADTLMGGCGSAEGVAAALPACRSFVESHARASGHRPSESLLAWATAYQLLCRGVQGAVFDPARGRYRCAAAAVELAARLMQRAHVDAIGEDAAGVAGA